MSLDEYELYKDHYNEYSETIHAQENLLKIEKAKKEMYKIKKEHKFIFTPRFISEKHIREHAERCENTIKAINLILKETREGENTPLRGIIPRKRQYNVPKADLYEKAIELVNPQFPSIMESRIDGCALENMDFMTYEVNANRAGWENSRSFCDIYNQYFKDILPGKTMDYADGWESIIKYTLKKIKGKKAMYLTEQGGKESIAALRDRGIDIDFVRFQDIGALKKKGELEITKDEVRYRGQKVDLICRFLRTHQVLAMPELCECAKNGNVQLINQMDAFYGGLKTLLVKLQDRNVAGSYAKGDIINIPESGFLKDYEKSLIEKNKDRYVLKFGNRGGGKAVYFGSENTQGSWRELVDCSLEKYPETAMLQEFIEPSLTPSLENGKPSMQKTTCDIFVFTKDKPRFGGVFSRWSYDNLVNFKTGGIKQTVFVS